MASPTNQYDVEIETRRLRWTFWHRIGDGVVNLFTVGSLGFPIWVLGVKVVQPLAGKTTHADINVNVGISITLAGSLALNLFQSWKGTQRKQTIREQRERMRRQEEQLGLPPAPERRAFGRRDRS